MAGRVQVTVAPYYYHYAKNAFAAARKFEFDESNKAQINLEKPKKDKVPASTVILHVDADDEKHTIKIHSGKDNDKSLNGDINTVYEDLKKILDGVKTAKAEELLVKWYQITEAGSK